MPGVISIIYLSLWFVFTCKYKITDSIIKMMSLLWIVLIIAYILNDEYFVPLSSRFDELIVVFFTFFFVFYLSFKNGCKKIRTSNTAFNIKPFINEKLLFLIAVVTFLYSIAMFIYLFYSYGNLFSLRDSLIDNGSMIKVGISFPLNAAAFFYAKYTKKTKVAAFFAIFMFLLAIASTSKIFFIITMLYIIPWYESNYKLSISKLVFVVLIGIAFFIGIHLALNKVAGPEKSGIVPVLNTLKGYILGSIAALQLILDGDYILPENIYIDRILALLPGSVFEMPYFVNQENWVKTGDWYGNVYTAFAFWYQPKGMMSVIMFASLLGLLYGFINSKKTKAMVFLKIYSYYPLIFILFSEQFALSVSQWLAFIFASLMISWIIPNKISREQENA